MNDFSKFNKIRKEVNRNSDEITNVSEVSGESGFKALHILWLYPDIMNIHGGRGDIMAMIHVANLLELPVVVRRCDSLRSDIDWDWAHLAYMTAGEIKCVPDVIKALRRQYKGLESFINREGTFIANGSSGAVLADNIELFDGEKIKGLELLHMDWKIRESVWGDDIWAECEISNGEEVKTLDVIGNQIQVADVTLAEGQEAFGSLVYGRGNNGKTSDGGAGLEGARTANVIYTSVLGPLMTKNPLLTESVLKNAANHAGIKVQKSLSSEDIEMEIKSSEYIKDFMRKKGI